MNKLFRSVSLGLVALLALCALPIHAQTATTQTTLASAITVSQRTFQLASVTGVVAGQTALWTEGEYLPVVAVNTTSKFVTVATRGASGSRAVTHAANSVVWVGNLTNSFPVFLTYDPAGSCTAANTFAPTIALSSARMWRCDSGTGDWQPFFSTGSITPVATPAAIGTSAQTFTVTGLQSGEPIVVVGQPAPTSLCPLVAARVTAANTVSLYWSTLTAAACTPASGTYNFTVPRFN